MGSRVKGFSKQFVYRHLDSDSVGAPVQIGSLGKKSPEEGRGLVRIRSGSVPQI